MALSTFLMLYNHHQYPFPDFLIVPNRILHPLNNNSLCLLPAFLHQSTVISILLSVSIHLPILSSEYRWNHLYIKYHLYIKSSNIQYICPLCVCKPFFSDIFIVGDKLRVYKTSSTNILSQPAMVAGHLWCSWLQGLSQKEGGVSFASMFTSVSAHANTVWAPPRESKHDFAH